MSPPTGKQDQGRFGQQQGLAPLLAQQQFATAQQVQVATCRIVMAVGVLAQVAGKEEIGPGCGMGQQYREWIHV
ncbi:hypothetical protein NUITMVA1_02630 [Aeromonas hydrophila]|nr:hypothetical protein NUITMVA1_02630 [Aeromonas hydrophila]